MSQLRFVFLPSIEEEMQAYKPHYRRVTNLTVCVNIQQCSDMSSRYLRGGNKLQFITKACSLIQLVPTMHARLLGDNQTGMLTSCELIL